MNPLALVQGIGSLVETARSLAAAVKQPARAAAPSIQTVTPFEQDLNRAIARYIADRDTDGNGTLSLRELGGNRERFSRLDVNGDGRIDSAELKAAFVQSKDTGGWSIPT